VNADAVRARVARAARADGVVQFALAAIVRHETTAEVVEALRSSRTPSASA
jgi:hypothetical protein